MAGGGPLPPDRACSVKWFGRHIYFPARLQRAPLVVVGAAGESTSPAGRLCMLAALGGRRRRLGLAGTCALALASLAGATAAHAAFNPAVVVTGANLGEPGIDVARDGSIYVNGPTGLLSNLPGSPSDVFRSDDAGTTWKLLPAGLKANFPGGGDSDISLDPQTGAIAETDLWLGSATVAKSTDKGQTWTPNRIP